jgi:SAM-dependent methyltransferase
MEWYPTPSYLVKRRVILEYLDRFEYRQVMEVGCGCGDLLQVLERKGYSGMGIDMAEDAVAYANTLLSAGRIRAACCTPEEVSQRFEVVIASEVLEHQQDDTGFLCRLGELLQDGGRLLLTVPAHMDKWGANDDFCGHLRRYEREELCSKLAIAGFEDIVVYSYGVPIYNLMKPFYDRAIAKSATSGDQREKTAGSGGMWLLRGAARLFRLLFNDVTMYPWYLLQRLFYTTDCGMGYFVAAHKKERT